MYAALRDAESALALCPSYQKALRRRLRCLQHLNWNKAANHLLQRYSEQYPNDSDFISRTKADLELALKSESGTFTCVYMHVHMCLLMVHGRSIVDLSLYAFNVVGGYQLVYH